MRIIAAVIALVLAAGCIPPTVAKRRIAFDELSYAGYDAVGTATIKGQAFLKTRGGEVKFAAGGKVYCNPVTSYSTEWYHRGVIDGETLETPDPRAEKYYRETQADAFGNFEFTSLPAGSYYLAAPIYWEVPFGRYGTDTTGATAGARVKVEAGETKKVILTR